MSENKISIHFHPYKFEENLHTVVKDEGGKKRRYLVGITSGLKVDAHGEKVTPEGIADFMKQANSGDILLYPDKHGIKSLEDIGRLVHASVMDNGDWYTEYRLYDEDDGVGQTKLDMISTLWKQINGLPPYTKKREKGFSIEGVIPTSKIQTNNFGSKSLAGIQLDGVVLVPRPAYKDSLATAVYKALGETMPERFDNLKKTIQSLIMQKDTESNYNKLRWNYADALDEVVKNIMSKSNNNKQQELEMTFDEFKTLMVPLILQSESIFVDDEEIEQIEEIDPIISLVKSLSPELISNNPKLEDAINTYKSLRNIENKLTTQIN